MPEAIPKLSKARPAASNLFSRAALRQTTKAGVGCHYTRAWPKTSFFRILSRILSRTLSELGRFEEVCGKVCDKVSLTNAPWDKPYTTPASAPVRRP
jgi:hypothetical protein